MATLFSSVTQDCQDKLTLPRLAAGLTATVPAVEAPAAGRICSWHVPEEIGVNFSVPVSKRTLVIGDPPPIVGVTRAMLV
jgi:hypothetical protein